MKAVANIDGKLVENAGTCGFDGIFGDGLYEFVRVYEGVPHLLERHVERMARSALELSLPAPPLYEVVRARVRETLVRLQRSVFGLNLIFVRMSGRDEIAMPAIETSLVIAPQFEVPRAESSGTGERVIISGYRGAADAMLGRHQTLSRFRAKLLIREASDAAAFETIVTDAQDCVLEGARTNVFCVDGGTLITPPLTEPIVAGTIRGEVAQIAEVLEIPFEEKKVPRVTILGAEEVFLTSAEFEIVPVTSIGSEHIADGKPGPIAQRIHKALRNKIREAVRVGFAIALAVTTVFASSSFAAGELRAEQDWNLKKLSWASDIDNSEPSNETFDGFCGRGRPRSQAPTIVSKSNFESGKGGVDFSRYIDPEAEREALEELDGELRETFADLVKLARDQKQPTPRRVQALAHVGEIRFERTSIFVRCLLHDETPEIRRIATRLIEKFGSAEDAPFLIARLADETDDSVISRLYDALAVLGDRDAVPHIFPGLESEWSVVRESAIEALRSLTFHTFGYDAGASPADRASKAASFQDWWRVQQEAPHTLTDWALHSLATEDWKTRIFTLGRVARIHEDEKRALSLDYDLLVPRLIDALEDELSTVRTAAIGALRTITKMDFDYRAIDTDLSEDRALEARIASVARFRSWWADAQGLTAYERNLLALAPSNTTRAKLEAISSVDPSEIGYEGEVVFDFVAKIAELVADEASTVRFAALSKLEELTFVRYPLDHDVAAPGTERHDEVRAWWRDWISKNRGRSLYDRMIDLLDSHRPSRDRAAGCRGLAHAESEHIRPELEELLEIEESNVVCLEAIRTLGVKGDVATAKLLFSILENDRADGACRSAAAEAISKIASQDFGVFYSLATTPQIRARNRETIERIRVWLRRNG
ncbi:MAG: aminotransferase class IV [Planctomycetes bacterium]|nr:aminotransferase class IV [Planctomycetota bacterium]